MVTEQVSLVFDHDVFVDHAPDWYYFADEVLRNRLTEEQLLTRFEVSDDKKG